VKLSLSHQDCKYFRIYDFSLVNKFERIDKKKKNLKIIIPGKKRLCLSRTLNSKKIDSKLNRINSPVVRIESLDPEK